MVDIERTGFDTSTRIPASGSGSPSAKSVELIRACRLSPDDPIIGVGDVDAHLVAALVGAGHRDLTILHPSVEALEKLREALGDLARDVTLMEADALEFHPDRRYALWHDRGYFDRLTHADDRQRYIETVQYALRPEGHLVISASGPEAPEERGGMPVVRFSADRLAEALGYQFELAEHGLALHPAEGGKSRQLLHCRFRRLAPRWPHGD